MANTNKIKRTYGKEQTLGDIIYNPTNRTVFTTISMGFFGKKSITLIKQQDGSFDLMVSKRDSDELIKVGKTFPAKDSSGNIIEGITRGSLGLSTRYDKELKKEITDNSNAIFFSTHKLKESKPLGNSNLIKIGYVKGCFGIEVDDNTSNDSQSTTQNVNIDEINEDEIPF